MEMSANRKRCTCGRCLDGKITERMAYELRCQAYHFMTTLREQLDDKWDTYQQELQVKGPKPPDQISYFPSLAYIPVKLRRSTADDAIFKYGFADMMECIAECLLARKSPMVKIVKREWEKKPSSRRPNGDRYLELDGKIEYAIDAVLRSCEDHILTESKREGEEWESFQRRMKEVPMCANDGDWEPVGDLLLNREEAGATVGAKGPYYRVPTGRPQKKQKTEDKQEGEDKTQKNNANLLEAKSRCTCCSCVEGVMSKRVRFELHCSYMLEEQIGVSWDAYQQERSGGGFLLDPTFWFYHLSFIPKDIRERHADDKAFILGFAKVIHHIKRCAMSLLIPTPEAVMTEYKKDPSASAKAYLDGGGRAEYAIDYVLALCERDSHPSLYHNHRLDRMWENFYLHRTTMPRCRNDECFWLVRERALPREKGINGPYEVAGFGDGLAQDNQDTYARRRNELLFSFTLEQQTRLDRLFGYGLKEGESEADEEGGSVYGEEI